MRLTEKDLQGLLPNIKGLLDPRLELRLTEAFRRVYEIITFKLKEQEKNFENKLSTLNKIHKDEIDNLKSLLAHPLIGSSESDPVLQSVISSYGPQSPNHFLAGPIPSFRAITPADIPNIPATQLNADGTILDVNIIEIGEYLKRINNTLVGGFPSGTTKFNSGTLAAVETNLYTTPANNKTKIRYISLFNTTAGTLTATIKARDASNVQIFTQDFPLLTTEKIIATLNLILPTNYKLNGFASAAGGIDYELYGIEETLT